MIPRSPVPGCESPVPAAVPGVVIVMPVLPVIADFIAMILPVVANVVAAILPVIANLVPVAIGKLVRSFAVSDTVTAAESILKLIATITRRKLTRVGSSIAEPRKIRLSIANATSNRRSGRRPGTKCGQRRSTTAPSAIGTRRSNRPRTATDRLDAGRGQRPGATTRADIGTRATGLNTRAVDLRASTRPVDASAGTRRGSTGWWAAE